MKQNDIVVGIDLGTTNSSIAVVENGIPRVLEIEGQPSVPSCVSPGADGELLVGKAALNNLMARPEDTILSAKRYMGTDHSFTIDGKTFRPEEIGAVILRYLKSEAESILGQPVKKAVVTVPAFFNEQQRAATRHAAELAGLECLRLLNEPTAAALAYEAAGDIGEKILVYDLGGGTFDVSLVTASEGLIEVAASHGDTQLGGDDIDEKLLAKLIEENEQCDNDSLDEAQRCRLRKACEQAKIHLSDNPFATLSEEYLSDDEHFTQEIDRADFEEWITPLLEKTWTAVHASMHDGGVVAGQIDKILLVGGSTKIPLVSRLMEQKIGLIPHSEINPDLIVAMGAAIQGSTLAGEKITKVLVDITAHTYSTEILETFSTSCSPIIKRGTPLPCTKSEVFFTCCDEQEKVIVTAYQGESTVPDDNLLLGKFMIEGLTPRPMGEPIICEFSLDLSGMLKVTATEKNTGLNKSITIDTRDVQNSLDLDSAREKMAEIFGDSEVSENQEPEPSGDEVLDRTNSLRSRAKYVLNEAEVDEDDIMEIEELLREFDAATKESNREQLSTLNDRLDDILFYIE